MITFVTFHSDLSAETMERIHRHEEKTGTSSFTWDGADRPDAPRALLDMMFASASRTHPDCRKVLLTDERTPFTVGSDIELKRLDLGDPLPSLSRSIAWVEFLRQAPQDSHVVFIDYDMLVEESLDSVFETVFDVGLTYRPHHRWPINAGIQFLHASRLQQSLKFYEKALAVFEKNYGEWVVWCGDQWAFRHLVNADFEQEGVFLHRENEAEILLLPCDKYNFTPAEEWNVAEESYAGKSILHFKGGAKVAMLEYWTKHLAAEFPLVNTEALHERRSGASSER